MTIYLDLPHLERFGWIRVEGAVPVRLCERLVEVLEVEMGNNSGPAESARTVPKQRYPLRQVAVSTFNHPCQIMSRST
jgi:hypothetical protein